MINTLSQSRPSPSPPTPWLLVAFCTLSQSRPSPSPPTPWLLVAFCTLLRSNYEYPFERWMLNRTKTNTSLYVNFQLVLYSLGTACIRVFSQYFEGELNHFWVMNIEEINDCCPYPIVCNILFWFLFICKWRIGRIRYWHVTSKPWMIIMHPLF